MLDQGVWLRYTVVVINSVTLAACFCILWTYFRVPRLMQNPGKVIIAVFVLQSFDSALLILSQFYYSLDQNVPPPPISFEIRPNCCDLIGLIQECITIQYTALNYFLVINLYLQLRNLFYNFLSLMTKVQIIIVGISLVFSLFAMLQDEISDEISIGSLGICDVKDGSVSQTILTVMSVFILVNILILLIIILRRNRNFQISVEIYSTNTEKFKKKYLQQYARVNLLYTYIFVATRLVPVPTLFILVMFVTDKSLYQLYVVYLLQISFGGFILALIRLREPVFKKHFQKVVLTKVQGTNLSQRLMRNSDSTLTEPMITISVDLSGSDQFMDVQNLIVHAASSNDIQNIEVSHYTPKLLDRQIIMNSSLSEYYTKKYLPSQFGDLRYLETFNRVQWFKMMASLQMILQRDFRCSDSSVRLSKGWGSHLKQAHQSFNFSYIKRLSLNCTLEDGFIEEYFCAQSKELNKRANASGSHELAFHKVLIEQVSDHEKKNSNFEAYVYGNQIIQILCEQHTSILFNEITASLQIPANLSLLGQTSSAQIRKYGTVFVTHDNLISVDIITKGHKTYLTKGGGLQQLWNVWSNKAEKSDTLLPLIVGVISFKFKDDPCINITIRVNRLKFNYPKFEDNWAVMDCISQLTKSNVIGWITLRQNTIIKRFLAKTVNDGQFFINLNRQDFLLHPMSKENLIYQIVKDWQVLSHFGSSFHSLQFVYRKFKSEHLMNLIHHEEMGEDLSQFSIDEDKHMANKTILGQYDLQGNIGYLEVFWDDFWREQNLLEEFEHELVLKSIIETIQQAF